MSKISHASQLFLLALVSLIGLVVLELTGHQPDQLLREVVLAALVGGSVAVPPRATTDVTVSGPVNVAPAAPATGAADIHADASEESDL